MRIGEDGVRARTAALDSHAKTTKTVSDVLDEARQQLGTAELGPLVYGSLSQRMPASLRATQDEAIDALKVAGEVLRDAAHLTKTSSLRYTGDQRLAAVDVPGPHA
jgi:hypothetical protein